MFIIIIFNVINLNKIFFGCSSLLSLPDISKWNTNKFPQMIGMFKGCSSLSSLPDISKWNIKFIPNDMFKGCSSLSSLPNISAFKTYNNIYFQSMIAQCENLILTKERLKKNNDNNIFDTVYFNEEYLNIFD